MLLNNTVNVNITHRNKKIYLEKGYSNSIPGNILQVDIKHLPDSSGQILDIKCDYCNDFYNIRFCDYMRIKNSYIDKDACKKCAHLKRQEIFIFKTENNLFDETDKRGHWAMIEYVKEELNNYIKLNGYTGLGDNQEQNKKWNMISWSLKRHSLHLSETVKELGYDLKNVQKRNPNGYIVPFEELKMKIDLFVNEYGFFPSQKNLSKEFKIYNNDYKKHGTLQEIKEMLGYNDRKYLVDNNGFINKSSFEIIVANYLIAQGISYKREQEPFRKYDNNLRYRSDFTFYLPNKEIHLEVWGGMKTFNGQRELYDYDQVMLEKIRLYNKYKIELISVTPDIFYNSMGVIKKKLYKILSPYISLPFIEVKDRLVSTFTLHEMSDEELMEQLMNFSNRIGVLPATDNLRKQKHEFLYKEVLKRYDSYRDFANKFGLFLSYDFRNKRPDKCPPLKTPLSI